MSDYGEIQHSDEWNKKPIEKYLRYKERKVTDRRLDKIKNTIKSSPKDSNWESWDEFSDWQEEMPVELAEDYLDHLRNSGLSERTIMQRFTVIQEFLEILMNRSDIVNSNPVAFVNDETDYEIEERKKVERSVKEVSNFLTGIKNHQLRALATLLAKAGLRFGEAQNLDLRDVHIDHEAYYNTLDRNGESIHQKIAKRPDSIYIPTEPTVQEEFRGEFRWRGNKRERSTVIPIDRELKQTLINWLAVRPITESPHPFWVSPKGTPTRIKQKYVWEKLTEVWPKRTGFTEGGTDDGFYLHWFRYFFTTQLHPGQGHYEEFLQPAMIKYLRGDVMEDNMLAHYTQDWGDTIRDEYLDKIYQFGIYD